MKPYNIRWRKELRQKSALLRLEKNIKNYSSNEKFEDKLAKANECLANLNKKLNPA